MAFHTCKNVNYYVDKVENFIGLGCLHNGGFYAKKIKFCNNFPLDKRDCTRIREVCMQGQE